MAYLMCLHVQMLMEVYDRLVKCDELLPVAANEVSAIKSSSCADRGILCVTVSASLQSLLSWCRIEIMQGLHSDEQECQLEAFNSSIPYAGVCEDLQGEVVLPARHSWHEGMLPG